VLGKRCSPPPPPSLELSVFAEAPAAAAIIQLAHLLGHL
jgi:hypothetical protein